MPTSFWFARFYIVCEEALLALPKVRPLSAVVGHLSRIVKTWKDTESDTKRGHRRNVPAICLKDSAAGWQSETVQVQIFNLAHHIPCPWSLSFYLSYPLNLIEAVR